MIDINKKYRTRGGCNVRILCVDAKAEHPVVALVDFGGRDSIYTYTNEGTFEADVMSKWHLVEDLPYADFKVDDKVLVRDFESDNWVRRHFSHVGEDGYPYTFQGGLTSWSNDDSLVGWKFCKKAEE